VIRIANNENPIKQYEVAIATRNPRLRYQILKVINRLKLKYVVCSPDDSVCEYAKVIITSKNEAVSFDETPAQIIENDINDEFVIPLLLKLNDIHKPMNMVLGIDPGMRFGFAIIIDGVTVHTKRVNSPSLAADITIRWTNHIKHYFPQCQVCIRIGTGSRLYSTLYLREIMRRDNELAIELVNEQNTSRFGKSDQLSAILIAGRWGKPLGNNPDLSLKPKRGYVKSIKHLISQLTEGKRSLSTKEARSIIRGEKSLDFFLN
jgi:hypothetical protein